MVRERCANQIRQAERNGLGESQWRQLIDGHDERESED
jgi:hypothetical protein